MFGGLNAGIGEAIGPAFPNPLARRQPQAV